MNFVVILATMTAFWHRGSTQAPERKGKFLGLSSDDLWSEFFEEAEDPLSIPQNKLSVRDQVLQKLQKKQTTKKPSEPMPPLPIPEQLVQRLTTTPPPPPTPPYVFESETPPPAITFFTHRPNATRPEPLMVFDTSTNKFELTPPGFASHPSPITEGMFLIGGQFGQQSERPPNMTEENLKVFWSSVGDFIETVPFLPIQVNVPDLIAAMASFFSQRVPLINRLTNPNQPRPNAKVPELPPQSHYSDLPAETNLLEYRQLATPTVARPKKNKKRKQSKNKTKSKTRRRTSTTTERYNIRGSYGAPTQSPKNLATSKTWFAKPTEMPAARSTTEVLKLFHHNNSPDSEQIKFKNMPITRKNNRWADRELFNFKHSDISNSPIMILNMPSRPVLLYKFSHQQRSQYPYSDPSKPAKRSK